MSSLKDKDQWHGRSGSSYDFNISIDLSIVHASYQAFLWPSSRVYAIWDARQSNFHVNWTYIWQATKTNNTEPDETELSSIKKQVRDRPERLFGVETEQDMNELEVELNEKRLE